MRLHNAPRSPVLNGGVGWPSGEPGSNVLFNRGTKIHPGHGLWEVQLFLLKTGKQTEKKKVMMSAAGSHHRRRNDGTGLWRNVLGLKCG